MGMLIVDEKEFEAEVNNCVDKEIKPIVLEPEHSGRKQGDRNVPDSLRKIIGEESILNGRDSALELAKALQISPSSVSAYSHGAHSTDSYHKPDKGLTSYLRQRKDRVTKKALRVMQSAMNGITEEALEAASVKDKSTIAKDMSAIVKNMQDTLQEKGPENQQNNQFIFYAPRFAQEEQYEVITAPE